MEKNRESGKRPTRIWSVDSDKGAKAIQWEEWPFHQMVLDSLETHGKEVINLIHTSPHTLSRTRISDPSIKTKNIKLSEKNIGANLFNFEAG